MRERLFLLCLSVLFCLPVNGQTEKPLDYDVIGVRVGQVLNYSQFVAVFGKPDKYEKTCADGGVYSSVETYWKGGNVFEFSDGGHFCGFTLSDSAYAALTLIVSGGIKVGDKLSKLDGFRYGKPVVAEWMRPFGYYTPYVLFPERDGKVYLFVRDGIIEKISYSDPV